MEGRVREDDGWVRHASAYIVGKMGECWADASGCEVDWLCIGPTHVSSSLVSVEFGPHR
jgi:hypothetical protein